MFLLPSVTLSGDCISAYIQNNRTNNLRAFSYESWLANS